MVRLQLDGVVSAYLTAALFINEPRKLHALRKVIQGDGTAEH